MTRCLTSMARAGLLAAAAALASCGGGTISIAGGDGGVGSGGTGITPVAAVGAIEGFGSIVVNGIRYDISGARTQLQDTTALKLGMTVNVAGVVDATLSQGTATLVVSAADLRGAVTSWNPAAGTFDIFSVRVTTDAGTVFAGGLTSASALANGMPVQVHGLPGADGQLHATRIEKLPALQDVVVSGTAGAVDARAGTFSIGSLPVRLGSAMLPADWPASNLGANPVVRVRGTVAAGVLQASSVEPWAPVARADGERLSLSGLVSDFVNLRTLRVDGIAVDLSQANVSGGSVANLLNGARIEVTGTLRGGVLVVGKVQLRERASPASASVTYTAQGSIGVFTSIASFKVQGQAVDARRAQIVGGTAEQLGPGSKVLVTGSRVNDDVLVADRVEFQR